MGCVPDAGQVGVEHVGPELGVLLLGLTRAQSHDARIGEHDVEPTQLGYTRVHGPLHRTGVADVHLGGDDAPIERLDQTHRLGQVGRGCVGVVHGVDVAADVDRDDVCTLTRQPHRVRATLAAGGSGDECDLAFKCSHRQHVSALSATKFGQTLDLTK